MNKKTTIKTLFLKGILAAFVLFVMTGCDDDECPNQQSSDAVTVTNGAFVLNSGNFTKNNASVTAWNYNTQTAYPYYFAQKVGRQLGDTGNDMLRVGNVLYIIVYGSNTLEVVELPTWKSVKTIPMLKDGAASGPRQILEHNGKLYVSCFNDYVAVINTTTLEIENWIAVGKDPEGIVASNGKIYVANSGGLDYPNYDSTISVIDPVTALEEKKITVEVNLVNLAVDAAGELYVVSNGNYGDIPPRLFVVNPATGEVKKKFDFDAQKVAIKDDAGYVAVGGYDFGLGKFVSKVVKINTSTEEVTNNELIPASNFQNFFGLDVDPGTGDIYCTDSRDFKVSGDVFCFGADGTLKFSFKAGVMPCKVVFYTN